MRQESRSNEPEIGFVHGLPVSAMDKNEDFAFGSGSGIDVQSFGRAWAIWDIPVDPAGGGGFFAFLFPKGEMIRKIGHPAPVIVLLVKPGPVVLFINIHSPESGY